MVAVSQQILKVRHYMGQGLNRRDSWHTVQPISRRSGLRPYPVMSMTLFSIFMHAMRSEAAQQPAAGLMPELWSPMVSNGDSIHVAVPRLKSGDTRPVGDDGSPLHRGVYLMLLAMKSVPCWKRSYDVDQTLAVAFVWSVLPAQVVCVLPCSVTIPAGGFEYRPNGFRMRGKKFVAEGCVFAGGGGNDMVYGFVRFSSR